MRDLSEREWLLLGFRRKVKMKVIVKIDENLGLKKPVR